MEYKRCSSCIPRLGALTGYYQPGQLSPEDIGAGDSRLPAGTDRLIYNHVVELHNLVQRWNQQNVLVDQYFNLHLQNPESKFDDFKKKIAVARRDLRQLVQAMEPVVLKLEVLAKSEYAEEVPFTSLTILDISAPNMEYKRSSSSIPGALTGYYQPGQLSPGFLVSLLLLLPPPFSSGLGTSKDGVYSMSLLLTYLKAMIIMQFDFALTNVPEPHNWVSQLHQSYTAQFNRLDQRVDDMTPDSDLHTLRTCWLFESAIPRAILQNMESLVMEIETFKTP
ncbi:hypothetical protein LAZ67_7000640 [Cordylochernes scorpioides]|uniref:Uncharacterized protein n=1 Tax=Cordylochernes scorpioides TaxID=51811 RepID=A0ABY6KML8_9ARAC|nr:hypothetical protein LAZ67_7000640 [Cordylochernes scorpioides]